MMEYSCQYLGEVGDHRREFYVGIQVPITTLCLCSREISDRGAHNQRGVEDVVREVTQRLEKLDNFLWFSVESENLESIHNHSAYA